MDQENKLLKTEEEDVAKTAYQPDGSFGTSRAAWGISNIILDPRYQARPIILGLLMLGFAELQLSSLSSDILFTAIAYILIIIGTLIIGRSLMRIFRLRGDKAKKFKQFTLYFDRMLLLPDKLTLKYTEIEYIKHSINQFYSVGSRMYNTGEMHAFVVSSGGTEHRCVWYGPSLPSTVFDDDLNKLFQYLGFRQVDKTRFEYDPSLAPGPPVDFVPVKPSLMSRNMSPAIVLVSMAVVGAVIYLVWNHVAVKIMQ